MSVQKVFDCSGSWIISIFWMPDANLIVEKMKKKRVFSLDISYPNSMLI